MQQDSDNISDVRDFIAKSKSRLQMILKRLNWSEEGVLKNFNSNAVVTSVLPKRRKICSPKISSYPESLVSSNSLTIETPELQLLLKNDQIKAPKNFRELQANFSREQKLKIYEHVVRHTEKLENNAVPKVAEGEISLAEIVAQKKREEKRKKRKFRKSKPTHIEEVRSLVDLQMQALLQFIGNRNEKKSELEITKDKRKRSPSRDKRNRVSSYKEGLESQQRIKERKRRSKSRSKERFFKNRSRNRSKERTNKKRSRSKSYDDRKMARSREVRKDHYSKSKTQEEIESYHSYQRKDYENYYRRQSTSPQLTSSRVNQSKDRHHGSSSRHKKSIYDKDYENERQKYKDQSNRREKSKNREKETYYVKQERIVKHKNREEESFYRHRSGDRNDDHRERESYYRHRSVERNNEHREQKSSYRHRSGDRNDDHKSKPKRTH